MIAAPASGSGKTVITLSLLRALKNAGHDVVSAKAGPDFIDPGFHQIASQYPAVNLDPWAMSRERLHELAEGQGTSKLLLIEAMMGLFDGAADGKGSAADLAKELGAPIVLVVDSAKQSHSIAALVRGFRDHDPKIRLAGVILNKVGSERHDALLRKALAAIDVAVIGSVYRDEALALQERHLGLVQAGEIKTLEAFIENAAGVITKAIDLDDVAKLFDAGSSSNLNMAPDKASEVHAILRLGQHIAIAKDAAFSFCYPHLISNWRARGAALSFFSPLKNEAPDIDANAVYLPGGYPELHGETLASASIFKAGMRAAKERGARIYGECGGYMVLGQGIVDKAGKRHAMCGLLDLETSFEKRKLHLGYRRAKALNGVPLEGSFAAHEFHYTSAIIENGSALFECEDAIGTSLGSMGLCDGTVFGSYLHLIDRFAK